jgi:hypothetical protein
MYRLILSFLMTPFLAHAGFDFSEAKINCVSGDCENGYGTHRWEDGSEITGTWREGNIVAGIYQYRNPCMPNIIYSMRVGNNGGFIEGSFPRCGAGFRGMLEAGGARPTQYDGTWQKIYNPFTKQYLENYKKGKYTDAKGVIWEGEFDYIPTYDSYDDVSYGKTALIRGSFIFIGAKIDAELDEVEQGLFASEPTIPGAEINFFKARPDYLTKLRKNFVSEKNLLEQERQADAKASQDFFNTILFVASTAAITYSSIKIAETQNEMIMSSLNHVLTGKKTPLDAMATLPMPTNSNTSSVNPKLSVNQYRDLQGNNSTLTTNQARDQTGQISNSPGSENRTYRQQSDQLQQEIVQAQQRDVQQQELAQVRHNLQIQAQSTPSKMPGYQTSQTSNETRGDVNHGYVYQKVGVGGEWKQCEVEKSSAIFWAKVNRDHQANEACNGDGWTFDRIEFQGYEQAIPCSDSKQWKAKITDSSAICKKRQ